VFFHLDFGFPLVVIYIDTGTDSPSQREQCR